MTIARRRILDIVKLQAFESAARHGSFTGAAKELDLTQSAVSRQIKELENQLGARLFERVRQRVLLSGAGRRFLPEARRLLDQLEEVTFRVMASPHGNSLSIATLPTFGSRWLVPRLPEFFMRHPHVMVNLASHSQPFDLAELSFDAAIHYGKPVWAKANCRFICQEEMYVVAAPRLINRRHGLSIDDIRRGPLLHLDSRPAAWNDWLRSIDADETSSYRGHRFDQFNMLISAAVAGLGFGLLPRYLIEAELTNKSLVVAHSKPLLTDNAYYFVMPESESENTLANELYEWMLTKVSVRK